MEKKLTGSARCVHYYTVPSRKGDSHFVCTASGDGIDSETVVVNAVRRQELDHWQHVAAVLFERVHEVRLNQQRHRGLASWAESPCIWKVLCISWSAFFTTRPVGHPFISSLFLRRSCGASRKKVPRPPDKDLQPLLSCSARKLLKACSYLNGLEAS